METNTVVVAVKRTHKLLAARSVFSEGRRSVIREFTHHGRIIRFASLAKWRTIYLALESVFCLDSELEGVAHQYIE